MGDVDEGYKKLFNALMVIGACMVFFGIEGIARYGRYPLFPTRIDLAKLEKREATLDSWHLEIGPHRRLTSLAIPAVRSVLDPAGTPQRVIYPIASEENLHVVELEAARERARASGKQEPISGDPKRGELRLFVRADRSAVPPGDDLDPHRKLIGVIINDLDGIPHQDITALKDRFGVPHSVPVFVMVEGRGTPSTLRALLMLVLAPVLFLAAAYLSRMRDRHGST